MIRRRSMLAATAALAAPPIASAQQMRTAVSFPNAATVDAPCGPVLIERNEVEGRAWYTCLGIPYAQPPVGPLRYASPRPLPRWSDPRNATIPGPAPIQTLVGAAAWLYDPTPNQSEDCLTLNIWTPDPKGKHPVMVWIHGGAWRTGHGAVAGTNGARLARDGDVVVVTINYRLGALGWLAHPAFADPETGASANWGLQDQIAALRWVQTNIASFGGDPGNVTLFGQSAGGSSTASIAQDPRNAGLLHRAIIQSGSLHGAPAFPEMATAAAYAEALAKRLDTTIPGLRTIPAQALHQAELTQARDPAMACALGRPPVLPVLDGTILPTWPRDAPLAPIPLLIGTTRTEGTFWYDLIAPDGARIPGLTPPTTDAQFRSMFTDLAAIYRPEAADRAAAIAPAYAEAAHARGEPTDPLSLWVAAYTDIVFRLRARECAMRHAAAGHPTYLYEFGHPLRSPAHGVPHTAEIPFVFGTYADPFFAAKVGAGPQEAALSAAMRSAWAGFAHTGTIPGWNPVTPTTAPLTILGGSVPTSPSAGVRTEELGAWGMA